MGLSTIGEKFKSKNPKSQLYSLTETLYM
jgi:hypothetical protein